MTEYAHTHTHTDHSGSLVETLLTEAFRVHLSLLTLLGRVLLQQHVWPMSYFSLASFAFLFGVSLTSEQISWSWGEF